MIKIYTPDGYLIFNTEEPIARLHALFLAPSVPENTYYNFYFPALINRPAVLITNAPNLVHTYFIQYLQDSSGYYIGIRVYLTASTYNYNYIWVFSYRE